MQMEIFQKYKLFSYSPNIFAHCCCLVLFGMYKVDRSLAEIVTVQHFAAWFCEKAVVQMIKLLKVELKK